MTTSRAPFTPEQIEKLREWYIGSKFKGYQGPIHDRENKMITATRYHDFSYGHRVHGHESKCAHLHGHNGRVHFTVAMEAKVAQLAGLDNNHVALDVLGRVIDFSVIKSKLCQWVEDNWDHRFLAWAQDSLMMELMSYCRDGRTRTLYDSLVWVPFNPTAENLAFYLLHTIGPQQLDGTGVRLIKVVFEETRKCSAEASL